MAKSVSRAGREPSPVPTPAEVRDLLRGPSIPLGTRNAKSKGLPRSARTFHADDEDKYKFGPGGNGAGGNTAQGTPKPVGPGASPSTDLTNPGLTPPSPATAPTPQVAPPSSLASPAEAEAAANGTPGLAPSSTSETATPVTQTTTTTTPSSSSAESPSSSSSSSSSQAPAQSAPVFDQSAPAKKEEDTTSGLGGMDWSNMMGLAQPLMDAGVGLASGIGSGIGSAISSFGSGLGSALGSGISGLFTGAAVRDYYRTGSWHQADMAGVLWQPPKQPKAPGVPKPPKASKPKAPAAPRAGEWEAPKPLKPLQAEAAMRDYFSRYYRGSA